MTVGPFVCVCDCLRVCLTANMSTYLPVCLGLFTHKDVHTMQERKRCKSAGAALPLFSEDCARIADARIRPTQEKVRACSH